jgi:hypothetical protein
LSLLEEIVVNGQSGHSYPIPKGGNWQQSPFCGDEAVTRKTGGVEIFRKGFGIRGLEESGESLYREFEV